MRKQVYDVATTTERFVLTGAPGAGKTSIIRSLKSKGFDTVDEAATDVITRKQAAGTDQPWLHPDFILDIIQLQKERLERKPTHRLQFHDRSIIDSYILCQFLGFAIPDVIETLVRTVVQDAVYRPQVFFIESLDFIENTPARRIPLSEAIAFGQLHTKVYSSLGFHMIHIPALPLEERVETVIRLAAT